MRKLPILAASLTILCCTISSRAQVPTAGTTPAAAVQSIDTPYGTEYEVVINGLKYRAITPAHIAAIEQATNDLTECRRVSADQATDIASLHREIGLLNQVSALGDKIDALRADQLNQFAAFSLRQQQTLNRVETSVTPPSKSRFEKFVESWQVKFAFTVLGGAANFRTLVFPPSFGPCPVAR